MNMPSYDPVAEARAELEAFRSAVTDRTRIRRLAAESPWHPLLVGTRGFTGIALALAIGGLALLLAPHLGAADLAAAVDPLGIVGPLSLAIAACAGVAAWSTNGLAALRGSCSPLLPEEAVVHQRLAGELLRRRCVHELERRAA